MLPFVHVFQFQSIFIQLTTMRSRIMCYISDITCRDASAWAYCNDDHVGVIMYCLFVTQLWGYGFLMLLWRTFYIYFGSVKITEILLQQ